MFELFIDDALVRGVHVDDDEPVFVLGQNVDAGELRERDAERHLAVCRRCCD